MRFRFILILFYAILFVSCNKEELVFKPLIAGHAGFGLDIYYNPFPGNSQDAVDLLILSGGSAVELDIQLSKDGQLYCFHDQRLDTRTNQSGCIAELSYETLQHVNYLGFINQPVKRLSEFDLTGIQTIILDLRHYNVCSDAFISPQSFVEPLLQFQAKNLDKTIICLSNWLELGSTLMDHQLEVGIETKDENTAIFLAEHANYKWFAFKNNYASSEGVGKLRELGKKVIIFEVRSADGNAEAIKKTPDILITDAVEHALNYVK